MESATLDRLMTRETVAGERSRCSASFFRLIGFRAACPVASPPGLALVGLALPGLDFFVATQRSLAQGNRRGKRRYRSGFFCIFLFTFFFTIFFTSLLLLTSATKTYFIQTVDTLLTRFS